MMDVNSLSRELDAMHVDDPATNMMAETWDPEVEGLGNTALPVHVPDAGTEATFTPTDSVKPDVVRGLLSVIRRLHDLVEEETVALETRKKIDFDDFSMRKSRSMLEFVRLMRAQVDLSGEAELAAEIQRLRQKLDRNRAVLEMHFEAAREVAAIIVSAIREAESDGTYSANASQERK
ncbi:MAG: flagellar biosynthesis protein FlgN [Bradyrhizobium sp.]